MDVKHIVFGRRAVLEALRSNSALDEILILKDRRGAAMGEIENEAAARSVPLREMPVKVFHDLAPNGNHQGVIAKLTRLEFEYTSVDDILEFAKQRNEKPLLAILDEITDPHNLGAIIRSAECAGFHGVIIPRHRSA